MTRPSRLCPWPFPFDPEAELDWGDPVLSRRLLREHLDSSHDSASRRPATVERHLKRLARLLPGPPARILDLGCGPGLYAVPLAERGYDVTGIDIGPAVVRHARRSARERGVTHRCRFHVGDIRDLRGVGGGFDACLLIYHVLEAFPPRDQMRILRAAAACLEPGADLILEMRPEPDHPPGRISNWDVVESSLLSDRPHLLLTDSLYEPQRHTYILREIAVFDDGRTAVQQTTAAFTPLRRIGSLLLRAGFRLIATYDGWTTRRAADGCLSVVVRARRL